MKKDMVQFESDSVGGENIHDNPKSWIAWKKEADTAQAEIEQLQAELDEVKSYTADRDMEIARLRERLVEAERLLGDFIEAYNSTGISSELAAVYDKADTFLAPSQATTLVTLSTKISNASEILKRRYGITDKDMLQAIQDDRIELTLQALDALGVALANYNHKWTEEERYLYETAITFLTDTPPQLSSELQKEFAGYEADHDQESDAGECVVVRRDDLSEIIRITDRKGELWDRLKTALEEKP